MQIEFYEHCFGKWLQLNRIPLNLLVSVAWLLFWNCCERVARARDCVCVLENTIAKIKWPFDVFFVRWNPVDTTVWISLISSIWSIAHDSNFVHLLLPMVSYFVIVRFFGAYYLRTDCGLSPQFDRTKNFQEWESEQSIINNNTFLLRVFSILVVVLLLLLGVIFGLVKFNCVDNNNFGRCNQIESFEINASVGFDFNSCGICFVNTVPLHTIYRWASLKY